MDFQGRPAEFESSGVGIWRRECTFCLSPDNGLYSAPKRLAMNASSWRPQEMSSARPAAEIGHALSKSHFMRLGSSAATPATARLVEGPQLQPYPLRKSIICWERLHGEIRIAASMTGVDNG